MARSLRLLSVARVRASQAFEAVFVLVLLVALVATVLVGIARPAGAAVTSVYSTDEDGGGEVADFTTTDAIYGIVVTNVLAGGYVCAAAASPADSDVCLRPKVPVPAFQGSSSPVPLYRPGQLAPGLYRLIGFDQAGQDVTARQGGTGFTVTAGNCAQPAPSDDIVATNICEFNLARMKAAAGSMAATSLVIAALGGITAFAAGGLGGVFVLTSILPPNAIGLAIGGASLGLAVTLGTAGLHARDAYLYFQALADDPPDPNFTVVFQPRFTSADPPGDPVDRAYFVASDRQAALALAVLRSYERFQGAQLAGDRDAARRQAAAVADYSMQLSAAMGETADALRALAARGDGLDPSENPVIDQARLDAAAALQARVAESGFTAEETADLTAAGASTDQIAALRAEFAAFDFSAAPTGGRASDGLRSLADTIDAQTPAFVDFANEARALSNLTGAGSNPPTASFIAQPLGAILGTPTRFDATLSTPYGTIAAYNWDFGDGTMATGPLVSHTYSAPGNYQVTLTVAAGSGATAETTRTVGIIGLDNLSVPVCGDADGGPEPIELRCPAYEYRPDVETWTVAGSGPVDVTFDFVYQAAAISNQMSVYRVDDPAGTVNGIPPGASGYREAVLARARAVFPLNANPSIPDATLRFNGGELLAFYISPASNDQLTSPTTELWYSIGAANTDGIDHALAFEGLGLPTQFSFEDLRDSPDNDWDDFVFTATNLRPTEVPTNLQPEAVITEGGDTGGPTPLRVVLSGEESTDPDGTVTSWYWDFGDGITATGPTVAHVYGTHGTYLVTLTVTDDEDATATARRTVAVSANQTPPTTAPPTTAPPTTAPPTTAPPTTAPPTTAGAIATSLSPSLSAQTPTAAPADRAVSTEGRVAVRRGSAVLPRTGADVNLGLLFGTSSLVLGLGLIFLARRPIWFASSRARSRRRCGSE